MIGSLTTIIGPMFSGKTTELMRLHDRDVIAGKKVVLYKPKDDDRYHENKIITHAGDKRDANSFYRPNEIWENYQIKQPDAIYIDEVQFFDNGIIDVIDNILYENVDVTVSSLNRDYKGNPFKFMNSTVTHIGELLARADNITLLTAVCEQCGNNATRTYRTTDNQNLIDIGGKDKYEARCPTCYENSRI